MENGKMIVGARSLTHTANAHAGFGWNRGEFEGPVKSSRAFKVFAHPVGSNQLHRSAHGYC